MAEITVRWIALAGAAAIVAAQEKRV